MTFGCRPRQMNRTMPSMQPDESPPQFLQVDVPEVEAPQHYIVYAE